METVPPLLAKVVSVIAEVPADHVEPETADLGEHDALARHAVGHDHVECADAVGGNDDQRVGGARRIGTGGQCAFVDVANLALTPIGQRQIGLHDRLARRCTCRLAHVLFPRRTADL